MCLKLILLHCQLRLCNRQLACAVQDLFLAGGNIRQPLLQVCLTSCQLCLFCPEVCHLLVCLAGTDLRAAAPAAGIPPLSATP